MLFNFHFLRANNSIFTELIFHHCGVVTIWLHVNYPFWLYPYKFVSIRYDQYFVAHYLNFSANLNDLVRISKRNGFICTKYAFDCMKLSQLHQRMTSGRYSIYVFTSHSRYGILNTYGLSRMPNLIISVFIQSISQRIINCYPQFYRFNYLLNRPF